MTRDMIEVNSWEEIDDWWRTAIDDENAHVAHPEWNALDSGLGVEFSSVVVKWWQSYVDSQLAALSEADVRKLNTTWGNNEWRAIDKWWETYAANQQKQITEVAEAINKLNDEWQRSTSRFNCDPLSADWRPAGNMHGPLRITHEEDWSHWLAHLLRSSTGAFTPKLLGKQFDTNPSTVDREVPFFNPDGKNRRVDILINDDTVGATIEIKVGDTNYRKTLDTARLVEEERYGTWTHVLLLPRRKSPTLRRKFPNRLDVSGDSYPIIKSNQSADIRIMYWDDVSRVLRQTLLFDDESDPHWESSAYLFTSLIEQHICSFASMSPAEARRWSMDNTSEEYSVTELRPLQTANIKAQMSQFKRVLEDTNE